MIAPSDENMASVPQVKMVATMVPPTAKMRIAPMRVKKRSRGSEKPASKMMWGRSTRLKSSWLKKNFCAAFSCTSGDRSAMWTKRPKTNPTRM